MPAGYRTVDGRGGAAFEVRGSEFVGRVAPVASVAAAEAFVASVREEHADATHNVPAYRVRRGDAADAAASGAPEPDGPGIAEADGAATADTTGPGTADTTAPGGGGATGGGLPLREYQHDDGEPSGSAGKPALNVLQGRDLENVVAVVTRYYGGTNLGVGGLVSAYSRAVADAVDDARVVEERPHVRLSVAVDYDDSGTVRGILESADVAFEADYGERAAFEVRVPVAEADALRERLASATSGRAELE